MMTQTIVKINQGSVCKVVGVLMAVKYVVLQNQSIIKSFHLGILEIC